MSISARSAGKYIAPTSNLETIVFKNGGIDDIVEVILFADKVGTPFTSALAEKLKGETDEDTLRNVFYFANRNFKYVRDRVGKEVVKSPGKFWKDRRGDCKSYSVFIGSLLQNLGFKYKYRVAFYDPTMPDQGHIYPIAYAGKKKYVLDAIPLNDFKPHRKFDDEVKFWKAYDYQPKRGQFNLETEPRISGASVNGFWKDFLSSSAFFAAFFLVGSSKRGASPEDYMLPRLLGLGAGYLLVKAIAKQK
ncbi:MAG TPA: transglutaminase domain-containing protein [Saprospiraceae bacterium]|nr:transglutaminase domain-containing protein [Saprospiraceae bacterium]HMP13485.1 transglutaminase domain-containing protein [Saprospiraceae bacterium]